MSGRYLSLYYGSLDARRAAVLLGGWMTSAFASRKRREARLADEVRHHLGEGAVFAYASARGALAAILQAAGVGPGDEVLLSAFTCLAVPTAVLAVGAVPRYVDIDPETMNASPASVLAAIGPKVRAIVVQHTMGSVAEVAPIVDAARERGILVIEDCALSLATTRDGRPVGTQADASIFSMELSKTLSTGWGGILTVRRPDLADAVAARRRSSPRRSPSAVARDVLQIAVTGIAYQRQLFAAGRYLVAACFRLGLFRGSTPMNELEGQPASDFMAPLSRAQLALAVHQWRRLPSVAAASATNMTTLRSALAAAGLQPLGQPDAGDVQVSPRLCFLADDRARTVEWFAQQGVEIGSWFDGPLTPIPSSPAFAFDVGRFPKAAGLARHIVNLPTHVAIDARDCARIADLVGRFAQERRPARITTLEFLGNGVEHVPHSA